MADQKDRTPRDAEMDEFWDIERLLPNTPSKHPRPIPAAHMTTRKPTAVELEAPPQRILKIPVTDRSNTSTLLSNETVTASPLTHAVTKTHYVPPHTADEAARAPSPCDEYTPVGVLLHRVKLYDWRSNYHYFDQFTKDAERYAAIKGATETRREPFFSYFPQYSQMNRRQAAWYLRWRDLVRNKQYPETDYAYVLLYLFELINLPVKSPEEAALSRDAMARVWVAYRRAYPQIDHYMCEWLCDYCLIHHLPSPNDILAPALHDILSACRFKEFYLSVAVAVEDNGEADLTTARILLRHCCQYDYRKSKFAQGEHKALFDRVIPGAIAATFHLLTGGNGHPPAIAMQDSTVTRDAFTGALCAYDNKRRIEVSYTSFSRSHELRFLIADMVKHTENRLRSWIGVRSRLSVVSLPSPLKNALDAYLAPIAPPKERIPTARKEQPRPAYEALYDLPHKEISLADADAIERSSRETTRILTEAFGGEAVKESVCEEDISPVVERTLVAPEPESVIVSSDTPARESELTLALGQLADFVRLALAEDFVGERAFASNLRKMPDAIADEINGITIDCVIFDVILEDVGGGYAVIEDYRETLNEMLFGGEG